MKWPPRHTVQVVVCVVGWTGQEKWRRSGDKGVGMVVSEPEKAGLGVEDEGENDSEGLKV